MKKNINQIITILIFLVFSIGSQAQDKRTLDTKVADILAQMPTKDITHRDKVMVEIISLGSEGFEKIAALLSPLGTGDDTAVRFALNSLSRFSSEFGKNEARAFTEAQLLKALKSNHDNEVKTFLINQLNLVISEKSIPELSAYLTHPELCEPATQALLALNKKIVAKEFIAAFPNVEGKNTATLVRALGEVKCEGAVQLITPLTKAEEPWMRKTALTALANIGAPESYKTLFDEAKNVGFGYDASNATEAFITYTNQLGENNEIELMKKACKAIFKNNTSLELLHNYSAALKIYVKYLGYEATPLLLDAVDISDKSFRYSVLNLAENVGGIADTRKWISKAESSPGEQKAEIICMLGQRGCKLASTFVEENLNSNSEMIRKEAIIALTKLKKEKAVPALIGHLAKGKDIETTKTTLLQVLDNAHLSAVVPQLKETSGKTKAAFIDIIASKTGKQYFDEIRASISTSDLDEKNAAFGALKSVSTKNNLDELIPLLLNVKMESYLAEAQMAVVTAIKGVKEEQAENGKILSALNTTDKKERILPLLPAIGGEIALNKALEYFNSSVGKQKDAAFNALTNWEDYSAANILFKICKENTDEYRGKAAINFARMVNSANFPDDQKLLQYRKIIEYTNPADQNYIIRSIGRLRTFLSIIYLEQFLDDKNLQQSAAVAIKDIALQGKFYGERVKEILQKAASVMQGGDSQYWKIDIENYISNMPEDAGFISMFNGENLSGWQGMIAGGNPLAIAKLSPKEREKAQAEADIKMLENWSVKDGKIVFSGKGHNLVSKKIYKNFEMIVDWLITKKGDSGIYLRGTPQVQIWDTSRVEVGAQVGSGGLYNNNKDNMRDPLKVADNPIDEWNTFRITMIGENVTVFLNGELVVDNVKMDNYWDRSIPIFSEGTIELQAHGNELAFRDIYVREINTNEIGLTQDEINEGFVSLFNGKNLDGWQGNLTDYYAENGELVVNPKMGGHGNLFTQKEYSDFIFRFEFQLTPGANNGLGIRAPFEGDAAYVGMELQILDNTAAIYANLQKYQYHGSVYGVIPAKRGFLNPVGDWNTEEVIVKGNQVKVILNGEVILNGDIAEASKNGTLDHKEHPGLLREKGFIGFLGHGSELKFRNIRIKDLAK